MAKQLTRIQIRGLKNHRDTELRVPKFLALEGPNGSGKSAVLQAVRIGVLGYDPEIGRALQATRKLLPPGVPEANVVLTFSDGFAISRTFGASTEIELAPVDRERRTLAEKNARIEKELSTFVPSFDLAAFLVLSAEKRREFLLKLLPRTAGDLDEVKWREWLGYAGADAATQGAIDWLWNKKVLDSASLLDGLAAALEATTARFNEAERDRRDQESVAASAAIDAERSTATAAFDPARLPWLQAQLQALEERAGHLVAHVERAERMGTEERRRAHQRSVLDLRISGARDTIERCELSRETVDPAALEPLRAAHDQARKKARSQPEAVRYLGEQLTAARTKRELLQKRLTELQGKDACPLCGTAASLSDARAQLIEELNAATLAEAWRAEAVAAAEELQCELDTAYVDAGVEFDRVDAAIQRQAQLDLKLASARKALEEAEADLVVLNELPPIEYERPMPEELSAVRAQIRELQAAIQSDQEGARLAGRAEADRERADRERNKLLALQGKADALKALKTAQEKLRAHVIEQLVQPVQQAANELLQAIDPAKEFRFLFERENRSDFDFGFIEGGVFRSYDAASTGEDAFLAIVLVTALIQVVQPAFRILMVDNAEAVDDQRRRFLQLALVRAAHLFDNVILAGCCTFADVEGWTVVAAARRELAGAAA